MEKIKQKLSSVKISSFSEKVYNQCKKIPKGKVTTYAELARSLNCKAYQAIGNALRSNPYMSEKLSFSDHDQKSLISDTPKVPCHRVIKSGGSIGGFKGSKCGKKVFEKIKLLDKEGVVVKDNKIDLNIFMFKF